jgi:dethiobiotin synthetase
MARGFFVTGTDTGVGKTFVSRLLVEALSRRGPVSYMKPVQTGCKAYKGSGLLAPDFEYVKKWGMLVLGPEEIHVPYRFVPACSPHLAARFARRKISLPRIGICLDKIAKLPMMRGGCVVVEGAGGVLVPLGPSESMIHLMVRLGLPVVLVATPGLGTLNHTFLTMCALASAGLRCAGLVVNCAKPCLRDFIHRDNVRTLRAYASAVPVLEIRRGASCSGDVVEFCNEILR